MQPTVQRPPGEPPEWQLPDSPDPSPAPPRVPRVVDEGAAADVDQGALFWNAHALLRSTYFEAEKRRLALRALAAASRELASQAGAPAEQPVPVPGYAAENFSAHLLYKHWMGIAAEDGSLEAFLQESLDNVGLREVVDIINDSPDSKLAALFREQLAWAVDWESFGPVFDLYCRDCGDAEAVRQQLELAQAEFERERNGRPRLLFREEMGAAHRRVSVEIYRGDITDIPFRDGDRNFFLVSKFGDGRVSDLLASTAPTAFSALTRKFDALRAHVEATSADDVELEFFEAMNSEDAHRLRVMDLGALGLPFDLGVVDICASREEPVDVRGLYGDLRCLDRVLVDKGTAHLLTVLTGYGPKHGNPCFKSVEVEDVLAKLLSEPTSLIRYLAQQCRGLLRVSVATFSAETADRVRHSLSQGRTVTEGAIDRFVQMLREEAVVAWLDAQGLRGCAEQLRDKAMQTVQPRDYHSQLCSVMRELVGRIVVEYVPERLGCREEMESQLTANKHKKKKQLMAGEVARWMNENSQVIATGDDRVFISRIWDHVENMNQLYINPGSHWENMTPEELAAISGRADDIFVRLIDFLRLAMGWTPQPPPPRPQTRPQPPRPFLRIRPVNGNPYKVFLDNVYLIAGKPTAVCERFKSGECPRGFGTCRFSHPCRGQGRCRRAGCRFDHPAPPPDLPTAEQPADAEASDDDGDSPTAQADPHAQGTLVRDVFMVNGRRVDICKFFNKGRCWYGEKCKWAHPCDEGLRCPVQTCPLDHPLRR